MLLAANANLDLLDILGDTREKLYMIKLPAKTEKPSVVDIRQLEQLDGALDRWLEKYPTFAPITDDNLSSSTK